MPTIAAIQPYALPTSGELPANVADWEIDPGRAVLLIHDMQRYFVRPFPDVMAQPLAANCARLVEYARDHGMQVCYSAQPGGMNADQRGLLKDFWGPGMRV